MQRRFLCGDAPDRLTKTTAVIPALRFAPPGMTAE